jgi:transposase-like protein
MTDPFKTMRAATAKRNNAEQEWESEMRALRAAGYSVRTIAEVAGVSHDTVWKRSR